MNRGDLSVVDELFAVHEDGRDVGAARGVDEVGDRVVPGLEVRGLLADGDDVGSLAHLERADQVVEAERSGRLRGRHPQQLEGRKRGRIVDRDLVEQAGDLHLGQQVHAVVAARRIRAQPDDRAGPPEAGDRRDSPLQLGVAARAVRHRRAAPAN